MKPHLVRVVLDPARICVWLARSAEERVRQSSQLRAYDEDGKFLAN